MNNLGMDKSHGEPNVPFSSLPKWTISYMSCIRSSRFEYNKMVFYCEIINSLSLLFIRAILNPMTLLLTAIARIIVGRRILLTFNNLSFIQNRYPYRRWIWNLHPISHHGHKLSKLIHQHLGCHGRVIICSLKLRHRWHIVWIVIVLAICWLHNTNPCWIHARTIHWLHKWLYLIWHDWRNCWSRLSSCFLNPSTHSMFNTTSDPRLWLLLSKFHTRNWCCVQITIEIHLFKNCSFSSSKMKKRFLIKHNQWKKAI